MNELSKEEFEDLWRNLRKTSIVFEDLVNGRNKIASEMERQSIVLDALQAEFERYDTQLDIELKKAIEEQRHS